MVGGELYPHLLVRRTSDQGLGALIVQRSPVLRLALGLGPRHHDVRVLPPFLNR